MSIENLSQTMAETNDSDNNDVSDIDMESFESRIRPGNDIGDAHGAEELSSFQQDNVFDPDARIDVSESPVNDLSEGKSPIDLDDRVDVNGAESKQLSDSEEAEIPVQDDANDIGLNDEMEEVVVYDKELSSNDTNDTNSDSEYLNPEENSSLDEIIDRKNNEKEHYSNDVVENDKEVTDDSEMKSEDVQQIRQEYINDLLDKSEVPDTIDVDRIKGLEMREVSPEELKQKHEEFRDKKSGLKKEWEARHGVSWPKYTTDVYSSNGKLLRKAGQDYDAHHEQPLSKGGENTVENITPLHVNNHYDHKGIHASGSPCSRLM